MPWDSTMPILLRQVIGDTGDPPRYDDEALNNTLIVAAYLIGLRVSSPIEYAIDVENSTISPDPTQDMSLTNLIVLKAASMILSAEVRQYGQQAIAIRDGTSAIDLKRDLRALQEIANSYAKELDRAVFLYQQGVLVGGPRIIVSPFKSLLECIDRDYFPRMCR